MASEDDVYVAFRELYKLISSKGCAPIMLQLAWQDASTYDALTDTGGPNGSIRFEEEYSSTPHSDNGLKFAIDLCEEVKSKHPELSYADLYQLAGVAAVEVAGGPIICLRPGRKDSTTPTPNGRLPLSTGDADDLRKVFSRMGLSDADIVALSGGHILRRAYPEISGFEGVWTNKHWKFDNSYFVEILKIETEEPLKLSPIDFALLDDPIFRYHVALYAMKQNLFFKDYKLAHQKFSEFGFPRKENMSKSDTNMPKFDTNMSKYDTNMSKSNTNMRKSHTNRPKSHTNTRKSHTNTYNWWWPGAVGVKVAAAVMVLVFTYKKLS